MKLEGVLHQDRYRYRKGRYVDRKYYGILKEDFLKWRGNLQLSN